MMPETGEIWRWSPQGWTPFTVLILDKVKKTTWNGMVVSGIDNGVIGLWSFTEHEMPSWRKVA